MGDMFGGGAKTPKATKLQYKYGQELFEGSRPIRTGLFDQSANFVEGGFDVRGTPAYEAMKFGADSNFNQAKDNTIARFGRGGGLVDAMTGLEGQRASTLTQGGAGLWENEMQRAMNLGGGMSQQSGVMLGNAGNVQAQIAAANAAQSGAGKGALGGAAGMYLGSDAFAGLKSG